MIIKFVQIAVEKSAGQEINALKVLFRPWHMLKTTAETVVHVQKNR